MARRGLDEDRKQGRRWRPPAGLEFLDGAGGEMALAGFAAIVVTGICLGVGLLASQAPTSADRLAVAGDTAKLLTVTLGVPAVILALFNHARSVQQQEEAVAQQGRAELWKRRE